jgi:hypothetical protein
MPSLGVSSSNSGAACKDAGGPFFIFEATELYAQSAWPRDELILLLTRRDDVQCSARQRPLQSQSAINGSVETSKLTPCRLPSERQSVQN